MQARRRRRYQFGDRGGAYWALAVPQAFAGVRENVLDMTGAVPAGEDENAPDNPRYGTALRWRLDRDGQTTFVYGTHLWGGRYRTKDPQTYGRRIAELFRTAMPASADVYHVFTAERDACTRGTSCPLTMYFYSYSDVEVPHHRPDRCPTSVLTDGLPWQLVGRVVPDGRRIW
ncbi:MAG: hypothetical protein JO362_08820 [Streptomycetaceae bacterium]|nr:hypothetical protein [Streptomycetaceae bacterium]